MRVYHILPETFGILDMVHRRLKIATIEDLNDPFEILPAGRNKSERAQVRQHRKLVDSEFGMLCFSRSWKNPVQWSHYADGHKGMCLGFDVDDELLEPVVYQAARHWVDWGAIIDGDEAAGEEEMRRWHRTKYLHWSYEEEVRIFLRLEERDPDGNWYRPFDDRICLAEVILGHRSVLTRKCLANILGDLPNVSPRNARLAFRTYTVTEQLAKRLCK